MKRLWLCLALASTAGAAELTDTPPRLRGDVEVGWRAQVDFLEVVDRVSEAQTFTRVGAAVRQRHDLTVGGLFTVYPGVALRLTLPTTLFDRNYWTAARGYRYEPDAGHPVLVGGPRIDPANLDDASSSRVHAGWNGVALGLRWAPFADGGPFAGLTPATMAVDFDVRTPGDGHHDKLRGDGTASSAEGGGAVMARLTGARRIGAAEPWLSLAWRAELPYRATLMDGDGAAVQEADGRGIRLDPADEVELSAGAELIAREADDTHLRVGLAVVGVWRGQDEVSAGTRLPAPLRVALGHVAVTGQHVRVGGRLSFRIRPLPQAEARVVAGGGWVSPHRLEQVTASAFSAEAGAGTFWAELGVTMAFRIR